MIACIGEPISWPRLERFALSPADATIAAHLAQCPACAQCLGEIASDIVALPPLAVPAQRRRTQWWWFALPALAIAAIVLLLVLPREPAHRDNVASIKGVGDVVLGLVRDRANNILEDATTFLRGDRWKVVVTCAPGHDTEIEVFVTEAGPKSKKTTADHPLAPARIACGNRVVVPGAFEITGTVANRICARVTSDGDTGTACLTVTPE